MAQRLVLVADDNADLRLIFKTILESRGYAVLQAADGADAVEVAQRHRPDLIFMDIMMPDVDGWAAIARMKADPEMSKIPVVAITSSEPSRERVRQAGFCAMLRKPVMPAEMVKAFEHCLEARTEGSIWIDDLRRRISS